MTEESRPAPGRPASALPLLMSACVLLSLVVKEAAAVLWGAAALFLAGAAAVVARRPKGTGRAGGSGS